MTSPLLCESANEQSDPDPSRKTGGKGFTPTQYAQDAVGYP